MIVFGHVNLMLFILVRMVIRSLTKINVWVVVPVKLHVPNQFWKVRTVSQRLLHLNAYDDALAPCSQTCPAEIDIPRYIRHIRNGDYEAAVNTIRERNPLLLACGRVCPHPCESSCRRGIEDEPVSINQLKRFVADYETEFRQTDTH